MLAAGALAQDPDDLALRVHSALERARPALLQHLEQSHGGELALLCLAALHDEVPAENRSFANAMSRLRAAKLASTYEFALRLMVMAEARPFPGREKLAKADTAALFARQRSGGGFHYHPDGDSWDLSNTQYGVLGMRAGVALGVPVDQERWKRVLRLARSSQNDDGGFAYTDGKAGSYASMTVAGIAVMEICRQQLDAAALPRDLEGRIAEAWSWMTNHQTALTEPDHGWWYYFLYGLERAAILSDKKDLAGADWYRVGAEALLRQQLANGGWTTGGRGMVVEGRRASMPVDTAFAVLFLRRKFQRAPGPVTQSGGTTVASLPAQADEKVLMAAVAYDTARGKAAVPALLENLRSPHVVRRKAAALALARISGKDFGYVPYLAPEQQTEAIRAAESWWLTEGRR